MNTIFIASNNVHKKNELERIFKQYELKIPAEAGADFAYQEKGGSFLENALGKARTLYSLLRKPVIADDSGLCVKALKGEPGVLSARFGQKRERRLSDMERNLYLLSLLKDKKDRAAYFVCCMVFILDENRFFVAEETLEGEITTEPRGNGGFGYDPLLFLSAHGCTVAELTSAQKDAVSHRGKAARAILAVLDSLSLPGR